MGESESSSLAKLVHARLPIRERRFSVATEDFKRMPTPQRYRTTKIWVPKPSQPNYEQYRSSSRSLSPQPVRRPAKDKSASPDRPSNRDRFASSQDSRKPRGGSLSPQRPSLADSKSQLKANENGVIIRSLLTARAQTALPSAEINSKLRSQFYSLNIFFFRFHFKNKICFVELFREFTGSDIGGNSAEIEERLHSVPGIVQRGSLWRVSDGGDSSHIAKLVNGQRKPIKLRRFSTYVGRNTTSNIRQYREPPNRPQEHVTPTKAPNSNSNNMPSRSPRPTGRNIFRSGPPSPRRNNQGRESTKNPSQPRYRPCDQTRSPPRNTRKSPIRYCSNSKEKSVSPSLSERSPSTRRVRGRGPVIYRRSISRSPSPRYRNRTTRRRSPSPSPNRFRSAKKRSLSPKRPILTRARIPPPKKRLEFRYISVVLVKLEVFHFFYFYVQNPDK